MKKTSKQCDECGRSVDLIHRVYRGHRYCATCYQRVFKKSKCSQCGEIKRIAHNVENAICQQCETDKPCTRCGREEYKIGKITKYGPVCNSCSVYFREERACGNCGRLSKQLSRISRLGFDTQVCPRCQTLDHQTCPSCHRYRLLVPSAKDGQMLCKRCNEYGEIPCSVCHELMPAGCGTRCTKCYWTDLLKKRVSINQKLFSSKIMGREFAAFGNWLLLEVGPNPAAIKLNKYIWFFVEVEDTWGTFPDYYPLVTHFSAERLRRVRLPMRWLAAERGIVADQEIRETDSELRRIEAIVQSFPHDSYANAALVGYRDLLLARRAKGKIKIKSIRLALRPAASLLLQVDPMGVIPPDQSALDQYLLERPGQKAAISGFVNYFNRITSANLVPRVDTVKVKKMRRKALELELLALIKENDGSEEFLKKWVIAGLQYFHEIPKSHAKSLAGERIVDVDDGFQINLNEFKHWLPYPDRMGVK